MNTTGQGIVLQEIPGLRVIHEDDTILVVDKPSGMLSQPGRQVDDSVSARVRQARPNSTGPLLVHRLDMDTSGLLVLAKNRSAHRHLQQQFEKRRVGKRYLARLCGEPSALGGRIHLPLRLDVDNRPRQVVCALKGKSATTHWHRCPRRRKDFVWFYPLTGRTHQLRVHAAHPQGLAMAIRGDRLYQSRHQPGQRHRQAHPVPHREQPVKFDSDAAARTDFVEQERLMLHAQWLAFDHPVDERRYAFQSLPDFAAIG